MASKKALKAKTTRTIDVQVLDVFSAYQPRIVVGLEGEKAVVRNSETGRMSKVAVKQLQTHYHRCSENDANAAIRNFVRNYRRLAIEHGLAEGA